jgi:hypothetical protein
MIHGHKGNAKRVECASGHELTDSTVYWRRDRKGRRTRYCAACHRARWKAWAIKTGRSSGIRRG